MVVALAKVYRAPPNVEAIKDKGRRNYKFNTIVLCKVQWAERRKTTTVKKKMTVVDMFDVPSSQGTPLGQVFNAAGSVIGGAAIESHTVGAG